jgi:hypothetical protein
MRVIPNNFHKMNIRPKCPKLRVEPERAPSNIIIIIIIIINVMLMITIVIVIVMITAIIIGISTIQNIN